MNDPNKAINVNLSSLLSLKAELLRKQGEVNKAKASRIPVENYVAKRLTRNNDDVDVDDKSQKANGKIENKKNKNSHVNDEEDLELLKKSQRVLQAKTKFYERMTRTGGKLNSDDHCLVQFNRKQQDEQSNNNMQKDESDNDSTDSEPDPAENTSDTEEDWVEYKDCLGRTRKCLRKDLQNVKKRDGELAASMPERLDQTKANWFIDNGKENSTTTTRTMIHDDDDISVIGPMPTESLCSEALTVISKQDEVRAKWESKELENLDKQGVHYQDVFFDEARQHGVGYYAFSTDEAERQRQQHELEETRQQTIEEQEQRDAMRANREKIIAERVLAAKNRQRARLGQPPLEMSDLEAEKAKKAEEQQEETKEARKERKKQEKEKRKLERAEAERELERKQHVRPWDEKKVGSAKSKNGQNHKEGEAEEEEEEWSYKPEREPMSQQEWNEKQRAERKTEFAPPRNPTNYSVNDDDNDNNVNYMRKNFHSMPPPTEMYTDLNGSDKFANFQSTKFKRRNYEAEQPAAHKEYTGGVTIPPPANMDAEQGFKLPHNTKRAKNHDELESSIEAGLRFLRNSSDKDIKSSKNSWTSKADYS